MLITKFAKVLYFLYFSRKLKEMILDSEMVNLGFVKTETFKKREVGVSKYCWLFDNCFKLTIEKNLGSNNSNEFYPVFRNFSYVRYFSDVNEINNLLKALKLV